MAVDVEANPALATAQLRARLDRLVATAALGGLTLAEPVPGAGGGVKGIDRALRGLQRAIAALPEAKDSPLKVPAGAAPADEQRRLRLSQAEAGLKGAMGRLDSLSSPAGSTPPTVARPPPVLSPARPQRLMDRPSPLPPQRGSSCEKGKTKSPPRRDAVSPPRPRELWAQQAPAEGASFGSFWERGVPPSSSRRTTGALLQTTASPGCSRPKAAESPGPCRRRWSMRRAASASALQPCRGDSGPGSLELSPCSAWSLGQGAAPPSPVSFRSPAKSSPGSSSAWGCMSEGRSELAGAHARVDVDAVEQATEELLSLAASALQAAIECPACKPLAASLRAVAVRELAALHKLSRRCDESEEDWLWLRSSDHLRQVRSAAAEGQAAIHLALAEGAPSSAVGTVTSGDSQGVNVERNLNSQNQSGSCETSAGEVLRTPEPRSRTPCLARPCSAPAGSRQQRRGFSLMSASPPGMEAWSAGCLEGDLSPEKQRLREVFGSVAQEMQQTVSKIRQLRRRPRY
eukprot:TRINITY_DN9443_c0_g1_i1.p1 TRINITY_DN9443_c0_g1~~TRINITY_DN9443_c0_g1_i1.p1  ORF type:complete len:517 (-),score=91.93 TRINITY_DN9443_c0_g1_i1:88-1638(-)